AVAGRDGGDEGVREEPEPWLQGALHLRGTTGQLLSGLSAARGRRPRDGRPAQPAGRDFRAGETGQGSKGGHGEQAVGAGSQCGGEVRAVGISGDYRPVECTGEDPRLAPRFGGQGELIAAQRDATFWRAAGSTPPPARSPC